VSALLTVQDGGRAIGFSYDDMLRYHGGGSPGGVAHAFKVLELALPLLADGAPPERRDIAVGTSFGGPGARDGFELVTRAVTGERYVVEPGLARPELGPARARFVFRLGFRGRTVTVALREGFVTDEFIALVDRDGRTPEEQARLEVLKGEMAARLMAAAAGDAYAVADATPPPR
jgi:hypothetical protein